MQVNLWGEKLIASDSRLASHVRFLMRNFLSRKVFSATAISCKRKVGYLNIIWYSDLAEFEGHLFRCVLHDTTSVEFISSHIFGKLPQCVCFVLLRLAT